MVAVIEVDKVVDMVADMEFDMVAKMEVDKVADMVADKKNKKSGRHGFGHLKGNRTQ